MKKITATLAAALVMMMTLTVTSAHAIDVSPEAIPNSGNITTILSWIMWGGSLILFGYFMFGLVKAGKARNGHAEEKVEAPTWPLVTAVLLAAAPGIFTLLTGV